MEPMTELIDLLLAAPFWVAVLRIATPLILGTLGVLLCERAGVLNLGIEGIMVAGAFAGWLAVYQGLRLLWGGVAVAALAPARLRACCTRADGDAGAVAACGRGWASRCWPPAWPAIAYRVSFPQGGQPAHHQPFAPMELAADPGAERADAAHAAGPAAGAAGGLGAVPHAAGPGGAHGGREPGRRRRPGPGTWPVCAPAPSWPARR
jgi:hypothetical protein